MESPIHRAMSIDYGVVIEGEFKLTLDSGESRIMLPGDCSVNRGCNHMWKNMSESKSGCMLFILLDVQPLTVNGHLIEEDLGELGWQVWEETRLRRQAIRQARKVSIGKGG